MSIRILPTFMLWMIIWPFLSIAQGKEINLKEVEVAEKALPVIKINERNYSFKARDYFIKLLMKSKFWQQNFQLKVELTNFANDSLFTYHMSGKTKVFVDGVELKKRHAFRRKKSIKQLNQQLGSLNIQKNKNEQLISISTN